jgi:tetratricopeptide (TPR) repeat protein
VRRDNVAAARRDAAALMTVAEARRAKGNYPAAIALFDRVVDVDPAHPEAYFERARLKGRLGDDAGAIEDLDRHLAVAPSDAAAFAERGFRRLDANDLARAASDFTSAIAIDPKLEESLDPWIDFADRIRDLEASGAIVELVAEYVERGRALLEAGDHVNAEIWFFRGIDALKDDAASHAGRGAARRRAGRAREAVKDLNRAIEIDPELAEAYAERARARADLGDRRGAVDDLAAYLTFVPTAASTWLELGVIRLKLDQRDDAVAAFRRAAELKPELRTAAARALSRGDEEVVESARDRYIEGDYDRAIEILD